MTAAAIETANLGNVAGALSVCGAVAGKPKPGCGAGSAPGVRPGLLRRPRRRLTGGPKGLPEGFPLTPAALAGAVNACTGVLLPPPLRTPQQAANLSLGIVRIPENFLLTDMSFATFVMSDLVHQKLKGKIGTGNENVSNPDPFIDQNIARVSPHRGAEKRLQRNYIPTGNVGSTKIVSLHTDKDRLVVVENENFYASVVPGSNLTTAIVVESVPTHCGFTPAELVAGWESLRAWVAGFPQPTPASLQASCSLLAPTLGGPCRIDPLFVIGDIGARIPPR